MRSTTLRIVVAVAVLLVLFIIPSPAADADETIYYDIEFTVDNAADIGDANPGDGRCEIPIVEIGDFTGAAPPPTLPKGGKETPFKTIPTLYPPLAEEPSPDVIGLCTLRAAVEESNAVPDIGHVVYLPFQLGVYRLTEGQLRVEGALHLSRVFSEGSKRSAINAGHRSRVFDVASGGRLRIDGLFISQGKVDSGTGGGAIRVGTNASLYTKRSVIVNSHAGLGGGIYISPGARFESLYTSFESNQARIGGGIFSAGVTEIEQSSVYDNKAITGGGIYMNATRRGGYLDLRNTSILNNTATGNGGGLYKTGLGYSTLDHVTVAGNAAGQGGGIYTEGLPMRLGQSIVADNVDTVHPSDVNASPDCVGPIEQWGVANLYGVVGPLCVGHDASTDLFGTPSNPLDPGLEPLQISGDTNRLGDGGELAFRRPAVGSPAIDVVPADRCRRVRDMTRPNARVRIPCDLGAIER